MKKILIGLHENELEKLEEIANSNGHLSKSAAVSMIIAQYGTIPQKPQKGIIKQEVQTPKKDECPDCHLPWVIAKSGKLCCSSCGLIKD